MSVQYSGAVRIAMLDAIEAATGTSAKLRLYSGTKPSLPSTAITSQTMCLEMILPSDWMAGALDEGSNVISKSKGAGAWSGAAVAGDGGGGLTFYRIYDSAGAVCHEQGTVTVTGGGGDLTIDSVTVATSQTVTVTAKKITAGNA